jgi:hypothetical protein
MNEWSTRWGELPPEERVTRLDVASDLLAMCQFYQGDPRLSAWQEGFLASMANILRQTGGRARISPKQWVKLQEIMALMEQAPDEDGEEFGDDL